jgi:hypothetical protein
VIDAMFLAFIPAAIANFCAGLANQRRNAAVALHVRGSKTADGRAVDIQRDATGKYRRAGFVQARSRAMFASQRCGVADIDAGLIVWVSVDAHDFSP